MRSRNCRPRLVYFLAIEITAQIGLDHFLFRPRRLTLAALDGLDHLAEFGDRQPHIIDDKLDLS